MRPGQQNKRGRGRNNNNTSSNNNNGGGGNNNNNNHNRKGSNPLTRTYDSSGPDVKIRGTAQHIAEKYANLARDAQSSGDRVVAENYLQHAEHYNRIIAAAQTQMQERFQRDDRSDYNDRNDFQDRDGNERDDDMEQGDSDENVGGANTVGQDQQVEQERHHQQAERQQRQADGERQRQPDQRQPDQDRQRQPDQERPRQDRQRNQDRPRQPRPEQGQPRTEQHLQPVAINDGSGPQPVIEGTPVEVALEEEAPTGRAPTRRRTAPRPRRQPRRGEGADDEGTAPAAEDKGDKGGDKPALVEVAGE